MLGHDDIFFLNIPPIPFTSYNEFTIHFDKASIQNLQILGNLGRHIAYERVEIQEAKSKIRLGRKSLTPGIFYELSGNRSIKGKLIVMHYSES